MKKKIYTERRRVDPSEVVGELTSNLLSLSLFEFGKYKQRIWCVETKGYNYHGDKYTNKRG